MTPKQLYDIKYRAENKDRIKLKTNEYYQKNRDKLIKKSKKYRKKQKSINPQHIKDINIKHKAKAKKRNQDIVNNLKSNSRCCDCNFTNPICLEFNHMDPNTKKYDVSYMIIHGYAEQTLLDEIAKCEIICRNCHRKKHSTYTRFPTKKSQYVRDIKLQSHCIDCKTTEFSCLEFHHINDDKSATISEMIYKAKYSLQDVKDEVAKCIVLCGNCHIIRHRA